MIDKKNSSTDHESTGFPRVMITVGIFPPEIGGPATYSHSVARWLNDRSYEVSVITALYPGNKMAYSFKVDIVPKKGGLIWHARVFLRMLKRIKKADVVYVNGMETKSFLACFARKKPMIYRVSGDLIWERAVRNGWTKSELLEFQEKKGNFWVRMLQKFRTYSLNRAHKVIVPSEFLGGIARGWGIDPARIVKIFNPFTPVEAEPFTLPQGALGKFVLAAGGRLIAWKGIDTILEATAHIPGTYLVVAGSGPERERLEQKAAQLDILDRVLFCGQVTRGELTGLFSQSDCFVINSRYEGLPHIALEAMAVGCPVIAGSIGGIPEVVIHGETGFLVPQGDLIAFINAIKDLREQSELGREMSVNCKARVQGCFSIDNSYGQVEEILKEFTHAWD